MNDVRKYLGSNLNGDSRTLYASGGIPIAIFYSTGTSTSNQVITETISKWTVKNNSTTIDLVVEFTNFNETTTTITIKKGESLSLDLIILGIKLVTASIPYEIVGQKILLEAE